MSGSFAPNVRLLLRSRSVWIIALLGGVLLPIVGKFPTSSSNIGVVLNMWMPATALLYMFLGIQCAQIDRQQQVDELIRSLPVTPLSYVGGKLMAVAVVSVSLQTLQLATAIVIGFYHSGAVVAAPLVAGAWVSVASAAAVGAILGFAAGMISRRLLAPLALCALAWAVLVLSSTVIMDILRDHPTAGMLSDFTSSQQSTLSWHMLGRFPNDGLILWNRVFWGGSALLLYGVVAGVWSRRRTRSRRINYLLWGSLIAGAAVMTVSARSMDIAVMARHTAFAAEADAFMNDARLRGLEPGDPRAALPAKNPSPEARVSHYRIDLDLTPSLHRLSGSAAVTIVNGGTGPVEELLFVLHPDFEVNAVHGTKSVSRQGQFVRVQLERQLPARAETTLTFRYQGTVMQWRKDNFSWMNSGLLANDVTDTNLMLTGNYGWYPLLGGEPVAWAGPAQTAMPGLKAPPDIHPLAPRKPAAEFSLSVTGWSRPLFTNLAQGADGTWDGSARSVWMVGGDLMKFGDEHVQVLVPAELEKQAHAIVVQQSPVVERLQELVPLEEPGPLLFVAVGGRSAFGVIDKAAGEPLVASGAVVMRNVFSVSPLTAWWPALGMHPRPEQNKVELALAALMARAAGLENDPALKRAQAAQDPACRQLTQQLESKGTQAVKQALGDLYRLARQRDLTPDDLKRAATSGGN